jgi:hypothetical protein
VLDPNLVDHEQKLTSQSDIVGHELNYILRYETLLEDFKVLCRHLKVERELPHLQVGDSPSHHYSALYDEELRQAVAIRFKQDIERFRYHFVTANVAEIQADKVQISTLKTRIADLENELSEQRTMSRELNEEVRAGLVVLKNSIRWRLGCMLVRIAEVLLLRKARVLTPEYLLDLINRRTESKEDP